MLNGLLTLNAQSILPHAGNKNKFRCCFHYFHVARQNFGEILQHLRFVTEHFYAGYGTINDAFP